MLNRFQLRCAVASVGFGLLGMGAGAARADATAPLDPNAFTSLGSLSGATNYVFNTGSGSPPTLTENGTTVITGVISNGFAVFDFSDINISTGSTITTSGQLQGSAPLAILSQGSVVLDGSVNIGATGRVPGPGGSAGGINHNNQLGIGGATLPGGGGGFGGQGGGGGAAGGPNVGGGLALGAAPNIFSFFGGGAGFGVGGPTDSNVGGGGGGAFELSALGDISIGGLGISNNGGIGGDDTTGVSAGGGGAGGGIFIATPGQISLFSSLSAAGGAGGSSNVGGTAGGGGGGGRILLETANFAAEGPYTISVAGGATGAAGTPGFAGDPGVFDVTGYVPAVPEPGIISILMSGGIPLLARHRRSEKRR